MFVKRCNNIKSTGQICGNKFRSYCKKCYFHSSGTMPFSIKCQRSSCSQRAILNFRNNYICEDCFRYDSQNTKSDEYREIKFIDYSNQYEYLYRLVDYKSAQGNFRALFNEFERSLKEVNRSTIAESTSFSLYHLKTNYDYCVADHVSVDCIIIESDTEKPHYCVYCKKLPTKTFLHQLDDIKNCRKKQYEYKVEYWNGGKETVLLRTKIRPGILKQIPFVWDVERTSSNPSLLICLAKFFSLRNLNKVSEYVRQTHTPSEFSYHNQNLKDSRIKQIVLVNDEFPVFVIGCALSNRFFFLPLFDSKVLGIIEQFIP